MINIYIDYDVLLYDLKNEKNLLEALKSFIKLSKNIDIYVLLNHDNVDLTPIQPYFPFVELDWNFKELCEKVNPITKDETLISFDRDNLYEWDYLRGKQILISKNQQLKDFELGFNKVYIHSSVEEIFTRLRRHIHI